MASPESPSSSSAQEHRLSSSVPLDKAPRGSSTPPSSSAPGFCPMCSAMLSEESPHELCKDKVQLGAPSAGRFSPWSMIIRFRSITVTADHTEPPPGHDTFGKKLIACFFGVFIRLLSTKKTTTITVLKDVSGYIMPDSMTLILGPPGSGKSTLLKVMAGKLRQSKRVKLKGAVLYNNSTISPDLDVRRPIAYITEQENVHLPFFTVRETIEFVHECAHWRNSGPGSASPAHMEWNRESYVDYILQVFGLKDIEHNRVGTVADGIKDSDRSRLTTAEIAMGTYSVILYDQPSSGQDSLITYDLLQMLQSVVHLQQCAAVISLAQTSPESFDLFDRILLLSDGQVLYQGPRQDADSYFSSHGFKRPAHVDTVAFLQDIAAGLGIKYSSGSSLPNIDQLIQHYKQSDHHKDIESVVSNQFRIRKSWEASSSGVQVSLRGQDVFVTEVNAEDKDSSVHIGDKVTGIRFQNGKFQYANTPEEASKLADALQSSRSPCFVQLERTIHATNDMACYKKRFGTDQLRSWMLVTKCLLRRQASFTMRLKALAVIRLVQVLVLGLFTGTLFYHKGGRLDQYEMNSMRTTGFISMLTLMLLNIVQLPVHMMIHRPVFYKQQAQRLFGPCSYVVAHAVVNIPQSLIEATLYSVCVYFLAQLAKKNGAQYFQYWCLIFLIAYMGSIYMIFVSAIAPVLEQGTTIAGFFIALNLLFSGSPIMPSVIRWYWRWLLYIIPTRWGNIIFTATQVDERYNLPCMSYRTFPFCLMNPTLSLGSAFLKYYELEAGGHRLLLAYAVIVIVILAFIYLSFLAYRSVRIRPKTPSIPRQKDSGVSQSSSTLQEAENGGAVPAVAWDSSLSVKAATLSFHKLKFIRYDLQSRSEHVTLNEISGYAKPGAMLALVGSTRSGKETLLNCIAGRLPPGKLEGDVLVNGFKLDKLTFCRISGYVEKLESHQQFLTVRETLEFSSQLRLGEELSVEKKTRHVEQVLDLLGLSSMSDHLVSNLNLVTARSNEVRRKLSIAVELVVNPSILFVEDATVQLDSVASREILRLLQSVALSGRTIISTLDHPSGEALSSFTDVLILKLGGQQVYFGPVGWNCQQVLQYFTSIPNSPPYNEKWNPVTYILEVLAGGIRKRELVHDFVLAYQENPLYRANQEELEVLRKQQDQANGLRNTSSKYPASYRTQAEIVFLRNQRFLWRNVRYTFGRLFGIILVSLIMGTLYLRVDVEGLLSMTSASLFPYIQLIMISGLTANNVIPQLGTDRMVYYRENRARMYASVLYPMSWAAAEVPYLLLGTVVFVAIGNGLANLAVDSISALLRYWLGLFLFTLAVTYFGIFITLLFPVPILSVTTASIFTSVWIASSGVSVPRCNIQFYKWLYWINPYQYAVNILTAAAFYCDTSTPACQACTIGAICPGCDCKRLVDLESKLVAVYGPVISQTIPASFVWDRLSNARVIEKERNGKDFMALIVMVVLFVTLAFVSFVKLKHNSK